jgi:hypothetical protein
LAKIAPDGRFLEDRDMQSFLDTLTEKELIFKYHTDSVRYLGHHPGLGRLLSEPLLRTGGHGLWLLPDPSKLNIPPAMLELWAQVVTGGELTADGRFEAWDEPTWQAKQSELAAMTPPCKDFPFPGWVTTEPHLWWRIRANVTENSEERKQLLDEWRQRSGRVRPEPEPDTWRTPGPVQPAEESQPATSESPSASDAPDTHPQL